MNSILRNKVLKYLAYVMIVSQGILIALAVSFYLNATYIEQIRNFPTSAVSINLKSIPEERIDSVMNYLMDYAQKTDVFYIRKDLSVKKDNSIGGVILAVAGNYEKNKEEIEFSYLKQPVVKANELKLLLDSKEDDYILGIEESSLKSLATIPRFRYGDNVVIKKLNQLVKETQTVNGEYKIIGLSRKETTAFLDGLVKSSGVSKELLLDTKSGYILDRGLMGMIIGLVLLAHSIVLLALFIVISVNSLPMLGKLMLLGWSKWSFCVRIYSSYLLTGFFTIFLFVGYGIFLTEGTFTSPVYLSLMMLIGMINFLILLLIVSLSSVFILCIKPITAIRERIPKNVYITLGLGGYFASNIAMLLMCGYIDGPYREIQKNTEIKKQWKEVSPYYIINSNNVGKDQSSFNHQSKKFYTDVYHWYKSIEGKEGVHIINTTYYSESLLSQYEENRVYSSIPQKPLWIFKMSPGYLKSLGISIDKKVIDRANQGARVYLIPEDVSMQERGYLESWLQEKDLDGIRPDDIETVFNHEKEFDFITYYHESDMFSWETDMENSIKVRNPVILLLTAENMTYKESESLFAKGLKSSYIKLEKKAMEKYLDPVYLSEFELEDNSIVFANIESFVDGLQKDLWKTIQLFFIMIFAVTFVIVSLLITLVGVFQFSYKERISVKKFLGYKTIGIYKIPFIIFLSIMIMDFVIITFVKSKIGFFYIAIISFLQLIVFYRIIAKNQFKKIAAYLKE